MKSSHIELSTEIFALDSNILAYAYDKTAGRKHEICKELIEDGFRGTINYLVPLQVLSEFYAVVARGKINVSKDEAIQVIKDIVELPNFIIERVDEFSVLDAVNLNKKYGIHYWDSLIITAMKTKFVTNIYTENVKDFSVAWINAVCPF
jgi:predicted nucleic acid-binding protein